MDRLPPLLLSLLLLALTPRAQAQPRPQNGWLLRAGPTPARLTPAATLPRPAFTLATAETVHPGVPPRSFLVLETRIELPSPGRYRFGLETEGAEARLRLDEGPELVVSAREAGERGTARGFGDWVETSGRRVLRVSVARDVVAPMRLRVLWERAYDADGGFPPEPVPSSVAFVPEDLDSPLPTGMSLETRALVERKGCVNCHAPGNAESVVRPLDAPSLTHVASRISDAWMERWLASPSAVRHTADMPDLFHEPDAFDLESLLHYLAAQVGEFALDEELPPAEPGEVERGEELYHSIGCVACHGALAPLSEILDDEFQESTLPEAPVAAPFGDMEGKWSPAALARFLREPALVYPDGRMPGFELTGDEATALARYLLGRFGGTYARREPAPERIAHGKEIFRKKHCGSCHAFRAAGPEHMGFGGLEARLGPDATPLLELSPGDAEGCLAPGDTQTPRFGLEGSDLAELRAFVGAAKVVPRVASPADELHRTLLALNCVACHSIDGRGGVAEALELYFQPADERTDLGEEGRLPPDLSDAGWRLTTSWLRGVLLEGERARPYLSVRMPTYRSARMQALPELFAKAHGIRPDSDVPEPPVTDELVREGREMMGRNAFACVSCHVYKDFPPAGSPGLAIERFAERLRYEWFVPFLSNPQRFRPGSRMPDFATAGVTQFPRFCDGDLSRQIEAFWAYLSLGEHLPPPEELAESGAYQLVVGSRPLVHRGFLEHAGSRGVAVGLPNGLSYAFDAQAMRLVDVWRGAFLDASGSWAGRGGTPDGGRGEVLWVAPEGPALTIGAPIEPAEGRPGDGARFRGYRLDAEGQPTLLYHRNGFDVRERVELSRGEEIVLRRWFVIETRGRAVRVGLAFRPDETRVTWRAANGAWGDLVADGGSVIDAPAAEWIEVKMEVVL